MDKWIKTVGRKQENTEKVRKFGFKISAQNSSLPSLQSAYCVWLNAAPDWNFSIRFLATYSREVGEQNIKELEAAGNRRGPKTT